SALLETAIIKEFSESYHQEGKLNSKASILECMQRALAPFDLNARFASDGDTSKTIKDTLRIWVRAQGASNPTEITEELFDSFL
ncbi:hypothetical protein CGH91_23870, partial [Vibrio parahaemolyticus]